MLGYIGFVVISSRDQCKIWAFSDRQKKSMKRDGRPTHFDRSAVRFAAECASVAVRASCRKRETEEK